MKKLLALSILTVTASSLAFSAASAQSQQLKNEQRNWVDTRAHLNAEIASVTEDVTLTAAAISNSYSAKIGGGANIHSVQDVGNKVDVTASVYATATDTIGQFNATAAAIGNSSSMEVDGNIDGVRTRLRNTQVVRGQTNIYSKIDIEASDIDASDLDGEAAGVLTSAAIANSFSASGTGNMDVGNFQRFNGDVRAKLYATFDDIDGNLELTTAAIGNSATYDFEDAGTVVINNRQMAHYDPTALTRINAGDVNGSITSTTAAMSNSMSVSTLPATASLSVANTQYNNAENLARSEVVLGNVIGSVAVTAAAIGNSATINNLPEGF